LTSVTIVSLLPELLGNNGDAANARVLAQRARWSGVDASVIAVHTRDDLPERVDAVVIGTGTDSDLSAARDVLRTMAADIREWLTGGVPILAVGTGWELLSWGIELADSTVEGLGIVPGRAVSRATRATGDLVVASKYGRLIGFENHARDYVGAEGSPLGRVESGTGNGTGNDTGAKDRVTGYEGVVMGEFVGTHLHGPVLARNPGLADHLVTLMLSRANVTYVLGAQSRLVDDIARAARNQIAVRLELATDI
jgi:hypothetical protein